MQSDLKHADDENRIAGTERDAQLAHRPLRQPLPANAGEYRSRSQAEQRNRNCQKREVIKEDDGKDAGQAQFQQQGGEAHQGNRKDLLRADVLACGAAVLLDTC